MVSRCLRVRHIGFWASRDPVIQKVMGCYLGGELIGDNIWRDDGEQREVLRLRLEEAGEAWSMNKARMLQIAT